MERITNLLSELHACLASLAQSTDVALERYELKECQQVIDHCVFTKPPRYLNLPKMEQEIQSQILWVKRYHTLVLGEANGDRLDDYFQEIVEGINALAESYSICLHNQGWTTVCRKPQQLMPSDAGHQKQEPVMEEGEPEEHEEILSSYDKFWYY